MLLADVFSFTLTMPDWKAYPGVQTHAYIYRVSQGIFAFSWCNSLQVGGTQHTCTWLQSYHGAWVGKVDPLSPKTGKGSGTETSR